MKRRRRSLGSLGLNWRDHLQEAETAYDDASAAAADALKKVQAGHCQAAFKRFADAKQFYGEGHAHTDAMDSDWEAAERTYQADVMPVMRTAAKTIRKAGLVYRKSCTRSK